MGRCLAPGVSCLDEGAATDVPTGGYSLRICSDRKRDILRLAFRHLSRDQRMDVEDQFGMGEKVKISCRGSVGSGLRTVRFVHKCNYQHGTC